MKPHYEDESTTVYPGDCLAVLAELPDGSIDAVATDPPYNLSFMGAEWDSYEPAQFQQWCQTWAAECLRVLKPGGHMLAFGGSRTWHRLASAVEDAGFEVRDSIAWLYGSGFPKSLDVSKAIDQRERGALVRRKLLHFAQQRGIDGKWLESHGVASASSFADWTTGGHVPSEKNWALVKAALEVTPEEESAYEREVLGVRHRRTANALYGNGAGTNVVTYDSAAATDSARRWQGWGTALKPAFEPIVVGRKPLAGTVAQNVTEHGTGALNIDGCRIDGRERTEYGLGNARRSKVSTYGTPTESADFDASKGRWPANVVLDEETADKLETARFFYTAKAGADERPEVDGVRHPTVKPLSLMRWLVRLVTPPGGTVLDPFAGSGTTAEACVLERLRCIAIEREASYLPLIVARLSKPIALGFNFEAEEKPTVPSESGDQYVIDGVS